MREVTEFLSVDLEVEAAGDLGPLVEALAPVAFDLHYEPTPTGILASFELRGDEPLDAGATIQRFAEALLSMGADARTPWDDATLRRFSIGVRGGAEPHSYSRRSGAWRRWGRPSSSWSTAPGPAGDVGDG
ncbi:MAG TPA: hypothetical protein VHG91_07580 [Longimicrobium sp.]|nr:hypothetical protein [Longimicrobium sp.]